MSEVVQIQFSAGPCSLPRIRFLDVTQLTLMMRDIQKTAARETKDHVELQKVVHHE